MRIYYTSTNNGDGSSSVQFFDSQECIDTLEDADPETYYGGEGGCYFDVEGSVSNITIYGMDYVNQRIEDVEDDE